jgi:hypothetical protein
VVRRLVDFRRSLLCRTPTVSSADEADLRVALLRLTINVKVYHNSTRAASAGQMAALGPLPSHHRRHFA